MEATSIARPQAELPLLERLTGSALDALEACLTSGILTSTATGVAFRHELARRVVEESLAPHRRIALHRAALAALAENVPPDVERLAHHAEAAGDAGALLQHAPVAAERAVARGAHREAAALYGCALTVADALPSARRAWLLYKPSIECYLTDQYEAAVAAIRDARIGGGG